jgi:predicted PurR-regulated permease PerM
MIGMKLQRVAMTMLIVFLTFYLLYLGQALLLPLVIAGAVAYLINVLAHTICRLSISGISMPRPIAMIVAIAVILASLTLVIQLITVNIASVIKVAPLYQQNLESLVYKGYALVGVEEAPNIKEVLAQFDFRSYLQDLGIKHIGRLAVGVLR